MTLLIIYFTLITSCVGNKEDNENLFTRDPQEITLDNAVDNLRFTKGIRAIFQDSKGIYWFGSHQEGVCRYDGKSFMYFTQENGLSSNQVMTIREDEFGTIWFGTDKGVCFFNNNKMQKVWYNETLDLDINKWAITESDLWFSAGNSTEIVRIDKGTAYHLKNLNKRKGLLPITGFSKGKKGNIWIACYSHLFNYNGKDLTLIDDSTLHLDGKSEYLHIRSIAEDSKGRVWIGNNGIGVLLKESDSIINFSKKYNLFKGSAFEYPSPSGTLMHVFAIKEDKQGNIWFGDRDTGAWRFDGREVKNYTIDSSLKTQHIWDIYQDNKGNLLFAMGQKGVYKFNGKTFDRVL